MDEKPSWFAHVEPRPGFFCSEIIKTLIKLMGCETFLELGVATGGTSQAIRPLVKRWIGVDINDERTEKFGEFYHCTTDEFFRTFKDSVQIVLIDADHHFESVKKDLQNSLKILAPKGLIMIHDTDPWEIKFLQDWLCGDSYKIIDYILEERKDLNVFTLPITEAGLTLVNRKCDRRVFDYL